MVVGLLFTKVCIPEELNCFVYTSEQLLAMWKSPVSLGKWLEIPAELMKPYNSNRTGVKYQSKKISLHHTVFFIGNVRSVGNQMEE